MKSIKYSVFLLMILVFLSCEKVIDLEVTDSEPKLVIEAEFDAIKQEVSVRLSKTVSVFSADDFPTLDGASIEIVDETGAATSLTGQGNGRYLLENYAPQYGTNYIVNVSVDGEFYSSGDFLPTFVPIDSLTQSLEEPALFIEEGYVVSVNFFDPAGDNFYRANRVLNGDTLSSLGQQFIFDDTFSEGNNQAVPFFTSRLEVGDTLSVQFISYSEKSFNYYNQLFSIAGESGQSAAPANPEPSWSNDALGHFTAYGYDTDTIIIQP
jgi:hypothetical protein